MPRYVSVVDGIEYRNLNTLTPTPCLSPGCEIGFIGQTGNTVATNVAGQGVGTNALPAIASAASGTQVVANVLVTASSLIFCQVRRGTTTPAAGAIGGLIVEVTSMVASTSFTVTVRNAGTAATLSTDYQLWYLIVN